MSPAKGAMVPLERIEARILVIRGKKVMIDADLAELYAVPTKALNQAVKRNAERFPEDFMFRLTAVEKQEVVTNCDHLTRLKFSSALPFAFTEHGAIQAANVLASPQAVEMSVYVVRAFVRLRELIASNTELAQRLDELERRVEQKLHTHDQAIADLINTIRELMRPPETKKRSIGFVTPEEA
ncbi:MAG: ORF6N domain-containing protein [Sterolibacteriaceae bacterium]|uniref:ORF6N domain-containing protein n=1 Tax=Candidatus Methylophosphatis roskildensis TaxID=2899263 RepID=A0A9D7E5Y7_9PROT|nr:ORF6N domain-containing protein [Candidatus Methylophosphatis roskildensis]MBK7237956.1 ORF6N domain-containing protein [Sterolibacteriaceae bacterium]